MGSVQRLPQSVSLLRCSWIEVADILTGQPNSDGFGHSGLRSRTEGILQVLAGVKLYEGNTLCLMFLYVIFYSSSRLNFCDWNKLEVRLCTVICNLIKGVWICMHEECDIYVQRVRG